MGIGVSAKTTPAIRSSFGFVLSSLAGIAVGVVVFFCTGAACTHRGLCADHRHRRAFGYVARSAERGCGVP